MSDSDLEHSNLAGAARLPIVIPVAIVSFFYASILEYSLPLYFSALSESAAARGGEYPSDIWSKLVVYQVAPWIVGPLLAGLLARRFGERLVWSAALLGKVLVPIALAWSPDPYFIRFIALWQGLTAAVMWIAGISLVQMVPADRKGLSNGLMMCSLGIGSVLGPVLGRLLLHRRELAAAASDADWGLVAAKLFTFRPMASDLAVADFFVIFTIVSISTLLCGLAVGLWGQRAGRFPADKPADWNRTLGDLKRLFSEPRFWALTIALCLLGGPIFQASNQFLPYRAEDLGLKSGSQDHGWIWLSLLKTMVWIPGGAAVGMLAGKRASGFAAVIMLAAFAASALAIGVSWQGWHLFVFVASFEFTRQFMRWSHAGFMSEHLPGELRATAIGAAITFSGLGSTIFGFTADACWDPSTQSAFPFYAAATLGLVGCAGLFLFDRMIPIRQPKPPS